MKPQSHEPSPHEKITLAKDRTYLNMASDDLDKAIDGLQQASDALQDGVQLDYSRILKAYGIDLDSTVQQINTLCIHLFQLKRWLNCRNRESAFLIRYLRKERERHVRGIRRECRENKEAWQIADKYRCGQISDNALDSIAKTLDGYTGDKLRHMARQLDDWKQFKKVLCNDDDPNF